MEKIIIIIAGIIFGLVGLGILFVMIVLVCNPQMKPEPPRTIKKQK